MTRSTEARPVLATVDAGHMEQARDWANLNLPDMDDTAFDAAVRRVAQEIADSEAGELARIQRLIR